MRPSMPLVKKPLLVVTSLGNPEPQFAGTRHSIGHEVLNAMVHTPWRSTPGIPGDALLSSRVQYPNVVFLKAQCYMNLSGKHIAPAWRSIQKTMASRVSEVRFMIVYDELEKAVGKYQLRYGKVSARGHNGLRSLAECFGNDFYRFGVGIGRPAEKSTVTDYVLGKIPKDEWETTRWDVVPKIEETIELLRSEEAFSLNKGKSKR